MNHKVSVATKTKRKSSSTTPKTGFGIASFVFVQKYTLRNISLNSTDTYCNKKGLGTKGWCTVNLIIDGTPFSITNTHMPFQSLRATGNFAKRFLNHNKNKNKNIENHILFGDLNSRSLLININEHPNIKDIKSCSYDKIDLRHYLYAYCNIKKMLEEIDNLNDTLHLTDKYTPLKETDALGINKNKWFPDFEESKINFLPTYKRDPDTGKFELNKGKKGRLPGYADRILYKTHMTVDSGDTYQPLAVTGNDHLPIMGIYKFSTTPIQQTSMELSVQKNSSSSKTNSSKNNSNSKTSISSSK